MGKRKIVLLSATAAFFAVCVGCIIHSPDVASSIRGGYAGSEMAINFTAAENKLYEGARVLAGCEAGENAAVTERGTPIGFAYKGLVNPSGQWQAIRQNGYIANTDKIGGMSALTIKQKTASSADLKVYWSDVPLTFDDGIPTSTHYQSFSGIADLEFVCDFDGYRPNYFSVVGVGTSSSIESMSLSFSCQNQYPTLNIAHDEAYGSVTGAGIHKIGESFDLVATANEGRRFVGWYAGSVLLSEDAAFRFTMPECIDHYDIEARYALDQFDMVATSNDATKGTVTGSGPYDYGETVTLAASPEDGYGFRGWYKNGSLVSTDNPYAFPMPAGSLNLVGQFSENDYEVTLSCDSSKGSVSGAGTYRYKQSVTLSASPKEGYSFAGWYEGETQISPDAQFAFAIPSHDLSYEARFTINSWEVSLASKEYKGGAYIDGSNAGSVSGAGAYAYGTQVELTAIPNEGYGFAGWFDEDGELVSESPTHSFAMPDNAVDLEARFAKLYTATVETDGEVPEGCVLPEGGQYRYGQEVSLSLPEEYRCEWWDAETFDVVAEGTDYAFTMPERDLDLILTAFEKNPYFGSYPQTEVTDSGLIAALNSAAGTLPTAGNATVGNWTSYNYYIFSSVSHFMWHADIEHADGNKYRGVYFTSYRPYYTTYSSSASNSYQDDNGYNTNTVYWFKYEPILWDVLDSSSGEALVLAHKVLDAQEFYRRSSSYSTRTVSGTDPVTGEAWSATGIYDNNWKYSDLWTFANATFYNDAFSPEEKEAILTKEVDNSAASTGYSTNSYACANTQERVFALSRADVTKTAYGFSELTAYDDPARKKKATDYAKCMGVHVYKSSGSAYDGCSSWWLRSPSRSDSRDAQLVTYEGHVGYVRGVHYADTGFLPASRFAI